MSDRTVLLADRDPDSLAIYTLMLEYHGYRVVRALNAQQAFEAACSARPDLVIAERLLPPLGDRPLLAVLKADPRTAHLPVVLLSVVPPDPEEHGADGYLMKPCVPSRVLEEVQRLLWVPAPSAS